MRTEGAPGLGGGRAAPQPVKVMTTQIAAAALEGGSILRISEGPTARAGIDCRRRQRRCGLLALTRGTQEVAESDAADPIALSSGKGSDRVSGAPIAKAEPRADGDESAGDSTHHHVFKGVMVQPDPAAYRETAIAVDRQILTMDSPLPFPVVARIAGPTPSPFGLAARPPRGAGRSWYRRLWRRTPVRLNGKGHRAISATRIYVSRRRKPPAELASVPRWASSSSTSRQLKVKRR
jgi:hypothetical protein